MNHFRKRIRRLRTGLMAFLLMLGSIFGVLTPAMQAYAAEPTITGTAISRWTTSEPTPAVRSHTPPSS